MKISVITPTYNSEKTIAENIISVISQSYKQFEQIIIDNCSSDATIKIVKDLYSKSKISEKLILISEKDNGIADAFNKGIKNATGDVITILNGDDKYFSEKVFNKVIEALSNDNVLFVHGNILFIDETYGTNIRKPLMCDIKIGFPFNHPTMFVKKELFDEIGTFNKNYGYAMDFEWVCRIYKIYNPNNISSYISGEPLVVMKAGGASWQKEIEAIRETKNALKCHNLWDTKAWRHYKLRIIRTSVKLLLNKSNLNWIVKTWRKLKWNNKKTFNKYK